MNLNEALFRFINNWPNELNPFFYFLSEGNLWWPVRIAFLAALIYIAIKKGKSGKIAVLLCILALPIANEATDILKNVVQELRPCVELDGVILRVNRLTTYGTASAHSANMAALATVFVSMLGMTYRPWIWIAVATGMSRIYVGVHYPSQVLLGWGIGILAGFGLVTVCRLLTMSQCASNADKPE